MEAETRILLLHRLRPQDEMVVLVADRTVEPLRPLEKYQVMQVLTRTLRAYSPTSKPEELTEAAEAILTELNREGFSVAVWEDVIPF